MKVIWLLGTHYAFNGEPAVHKMPVVPGQYSRTVIELGARVARVWYPEGYAKEEAK